MSGYVRLNILEQDISCKARLDIVISD